MPAQFYADGPSSCRIKPLTAGGCASGDEGEALQRVDFSWVEPTGWSNPAMLNPINTAPITALPVLNASTGDLPR
jgi:hypothetical protein